MISTRASKPSIVTRLGYRLLQRPYPSRSKARFSLLQSGNCFGKKLDYDRSIEDLSQAIRLDPKLADAYFSRCIGYSRKNYHDKAIEDYSQFIRLNPRYASANYSRGNLNIEKNEHDKAVEDDTQASAVTKRGITGCRGTTTATRASRLQTANLLLAPFFEVCFPQSMRLHFHATCRGGHP